MTLKIPQQKSGHFGQNIVFFFAFLFLFKYTGFSFIVFQRGDLPPPLKEGGGQRGKSSQKEVGNNA